MRSAPPATSHEARTWMGARHIRLLLDVALQHMSHPAGAPVRAVE